MKFKVGDKVAFGIQYYDDIDDPSTVIEISHDRICVEFDDGNRYTYDENQLVMIEPIAYQDFRDKIKDRM